MNNKHTIFSLLTPEQQQRLMQSAKIKELRAGEALFQFGHPATFFYRVESGQLNLTRLMSSGEEKVFKVFTEYDFVAEYAIFLPTNEYPMTAIAHSDVVVNQFDKVILLDILKGAPEQAFRIMSLMSQRIALLMDTVDTLTQASAEQRLVMYFSQQYKLQGQPLNPASIQLRYTKKVIAHQINVKAETLSRILKKLKALNLIQESNHKIFFLDINALCEYVDLVPNAFAPLLAKQ